MYKKIKNISTVVFLSTPFIGAAQEKVIDRGSPFLDWTLQHIFLILGAIVVLVVFIKLWDIMNLLFNNYQHELLGDNDGQLTAQTRKGKLIDFKKIYQRAWDLLPMDRESELDLGHDYDGIKELDNKLPPWWLYMFYATIIWAGAYVYVSHFSDFGMSQKEEYEQEISLAAAHQLEYLSKVANAIDETTVTLLSDEESLELGKSLYVSQCVACHGVYGEGTVGPNFTDEYWIHGGDIKDLFKTIKYGVPEKGMISWKSQLSPAEMHQVASYILTLQGTDPPNPKAAEGELYIKEEAEENI